MPRRGYKLQQLGMSREKNLVLILLAVLVTLILWNSFWSLAKLALFLAVAYIVYQVLKQYI
ncbi:MAG: hypothetical protein IPI63_09190 [Methanothrix sp.]|jgi:hypothetical protein|uniref:hypothetical protein n=1 Tax=Methanothrix sp. TaxID=90426 RepID=UPI001BD4D8E6|nr:hypothetical protein [Methanothrix sp.]MBK7386873.1 hypothetical protein [Methanothrix sp.]HPW73510.1 hypothetical protein [Methanothrix sp.]